MLTPFQFLQLAAAAWSQGPALECISTLSEGHAPGSGHASTTYRVSYQPATWGAPGPVFSSGPQPCPFEAVLEAIEQAARVGTPVSVSTALHIVRTAQAQFANAPAEAAVCGVCGQSPDAFEQCACDYVPMQLARFSHV